MTEDAKQEKSKNLIPKSFSQAFLAGTVASSVSFVFGVPAEYLPRVAVAGISYSLWLSWLDSRSETAPKKRKGRQIPFSHAKGSQNIDMEYSIKAGGHLIRENPLQGFKNFVLGSPKPRVRPIQNVSRPAELDEFIFYSRGLQLRERHVKLFLASAWKNRDYGKGLSARQWVRYFDQRPAWYRELTPAWYYAMIDLLWKAGDYTDWQLVVRYDNSWMSLVDGDLRLVMSILRWYEFDKHK